MKIKKNRTKLIQLMADYKLKCHDVASLLNIKTQTVKVYRCKIGSDIPDNSLDLLAFKVKLFS